MSAYLAYGLFVFLFVCLAYIPRRLSLLQVFSVVTLLGVIWGFSVQNGADWIWYEADYELIKTSESLIFAIGNSIFEPGFVGLMYLCGLFNLQYQEFVLVCAVINAGAWVYFCRNMLPRRNLALAALFIFLINGWTLYNEQLRQALALSLLLIAYIFWIRWLRYKSILLLIFSILFHRSAVAFVFLLALSSFVERDNSRWHSSKFVISIVGCVGGLILSLYGVINSGLLSAFSGNVLIDKLIIYAEDENYGSSIFSLGIVSYLLALGVLVLGYRHVLHSGDKVVRFCWFISLIWCLTGPLLRTQSILTRFEHYFLPFLSLLLCYLWLVKESASNLLILRTVIVIFTCSFVGRVFLQPNQSVWVTSYQNTVLNQIFGLVEPSRDDRKIDICENLRNNDSPFCDWGERSY